MARTFRLGLTTVSVAHRRLDQQYSCGLFVHLVLRAAAGTCSPAGEPLPNQLSISGKYAAGAESSFLADGLEDLIPTRIPRWNIYCVCLLAIDAKEGPTRQSTGRCAMKPRSACYFERSSALRCCRTLVGADTAHCVRGLRPLGVSRPARRPFNPRTGAVQLALRSAEASRR